MLVLSRKCGERVVVRFRGETVILEVLKISGGRIRIGIDAPQEVGVYREELWDRVVAGHACGQELQAVG